MHSDGRSYPFRPSQGSAVFRPLRRSPSPISDADFRHFVRRSLDGHSRPQRLIRDALFLFDTCSVDLLHHECRGRIRPAPQAAGCCPSLQNVGLSLHSVAVRGGVYLVYGERAGDATPTFINGPRNRCDRSPCLLDLAQTPASRPVPWKGAGPMTASRRRGRGPSLDPGSSLWLISRNVSASRRSWRENQWGQALPRKPPTAEAFTGETGYGRPASVF